jgi:hypothetical protein
MVTIDTAMHNVESERNKLANEIIKKNAGETIIQLSKPVVSQRINYLPKRSANKFNPFPITN